MKIEPYQQKRLMYINKKLYVVNDIDDDVMDENTDFTLGSVSKVFTAIVALLLDQEGVLSLEDPVDKYLPSKKLKGIKIIDLINHKSGLKKNSVIYLKGFEKEFKNALELFEIIKKENINTGEYGKYSYSNIGYQTLSAVIEKATGLDFDQLVKEKLFDPLDMKDSGYRKPKTILYQFNKKRVTKKQQNETNSVKGEGGAMSTVSDLLKFKKFHTLLDKKSISKLETFIFFNFNKEEGLWVLKHDGEIWGIATLLRFKYNKDLICKEEFILFRTNTL
jgi:CubicO group peptidase (beta-lactamase class C family)